MVPFSCTIKEEEGQKESVNEWNMERAWLKVVRSGEGLGLGERNHTCRTGQRKGEACLSA